MKSEEKGSVSGLDANQRESVAAVVGRVRSFEGLRTRNGGGGHLPHPFVSGGTPIEGVGGSHEDYFKQVVLSLSLFNQTRSREKE